VIVAASFKAGAKLGLPESPSPSVPSASSVVDRPGEAADGRTDGRTDVSGASPRTEQMDSRGNKLGMLRGSRRRPVQNSDSPPPRTSVTDR